MAPTFSWHFRTVAAFVAAAGSTSGRGRQPAARSVHRTRIGTRELVRLRRGAYAVPADPGPNARAVHRQLIAATVGLASADLVVSHHSAAVLHGLPVWNDQLAQVHLTRCSSGQGKVRRYVHLHGIPISADEVVEIDGFRVTDLARTVLDLACSLDAFQAVPIGDAALRAGLTLDELQRRLTGTGRRRGLPAARRTVQLLDARSDSPGESASRVVLHRCHLPAPEPQFEVFGVDGRLVGRADFGWPGLRTLGEFDGRSKYGGLLLKPGQTPEDALVEEKRREDALRDLGWEVARWIWADLYQPTALAAGRTCCRGKALVRPGRATPYAAAPGRPVPGR